jgi:hypothetical protein
MNEPLDDEDLVARYRALPRPEPSAALDAAVLAQARAAVRRTRPAWMAPLGAAAVVVLAVAVGWQLRGVPFESPDVLPQADSALPAERASEAPVDAEADAEATAATAAAQRNEAPTGAGPGARAPAPPPAPLREAKAERERQVEMRSATSTEAPAAPAPPAPAPPPEAPGMPAQALSKAQRAEPAPQPAAPPAPTAPPSAVVAPMAAEAASAELVRDAAADLADLEPAEWMDAIRRLREAGDVDAARAELRRLLDRHPDLELPEDLRDLRE